MASKLFRILLILTLLSLGACDIAPPNGGETCSAHWGEQNWNEFNWC